MNKLTDKQKKRLIADYIDLGNYSEVARKHGVSRNTVKNAVLASKETAEKCRQKKDENTADMLAYLDGKTERYKSFADYLLNERLDPSKAREALDDLSELQLTTIFGVLTDKLLKAKELKLKMKADDGVDRINENLLALADIIKQPQRAHEIRLDADDRKADAPGVDANE